MAHMVMVTTIVMVAVDLLAEIWATMGTVEIVIGTSTVIASAIGIQGTREEIAVVVEIGEGSDPGADLVVDAG